MDEFHQGQRLTAEDLNRLAEQANEGVTSTNQIVNGKLLNAPTQLRYPQEYKAPRFLDSKYLLSNYKWPNEPESVNQHLYICLVDSDSISFRVDGAYMNRKYDNIRYAVAYFGENYNVVRIVTKQDFDINTDLVTRQLDKHLSAYVPQTNYDGFVETPIPPDKNVHFSRIAVIDDNYNAIGQIFLFHASYDDAVAFDSKRKKAIDKAIDECGEFPGAADNLIVSQFTLIINQPQPSSSKLLDTYSNIVGPYSLDSSNSEPWEVFTSLSGFPIINPVFQIGTQQLTCKAFEDENYEIHTLDEISSSFLSAKLACANYCVIDVPRLSAFHAYDSADHPLSASPNVNAAFTVPIKVFDFKTSSGLSGEREINYLGLLYNDRNPTVPCWQVYPF